MNVTAVSGFIIATKCLLNEFCLNDLILSRSVTNKFCIDIGMHRVDKILKVFKAIF